MPQNGISKYLDDKIAAGTLKKDDAALLVRFLDSLVAERGLQQKTIAAYAQYLCITLKSLPDISGWSPDRINSFVSEVRGKYRKNTQRRFITLLKLFAGWLTKNRILSLDLADIKAPSPDRMTKTVAQMLSTDEVDRIIAEGRSTRNRCILSVLSESGMRPFELRMLKWEDLAIDKNGVRINVAKKTGAPRFIRLVRSTPYVAAWRNDHPDPSPSSYIFVGLKSPNQKRPITHTALRQKVLLPAARRAGIRKAVFPYLFRHSSVTRMLEEGYSDSTIRMVHWGNQTTSMLGTYGHVSPQAIDKEILAKAGVVKSEKKERPPVNQCIRCHMILTPQQRFCPSCGVPQDEDGQDDVDALIRLITRDPDRFVRMIKSTKELGATDIIDPLQQ